MCGVQHRPVFVKIVCGELGVVNRLEVSGQNIFNILRGDILKAWVKWFIITAIIVILTEFVPQISTARAEQGVNKYLFFLHISPLLLINSG